LRRPNARVPQEALLAEAGQAQFLVTGDKPLLGLKRHKSTRIVTPAVLLELL
jgi:predicted nucleic acid-binding protein